MNHPDYSQNLDRIISEDSLLNRITSRIRQSLELKEILTTSVTEIRAFLQTDRVMVYRFDRDGSGEVVAESIHQQRLPSLLGLHFPATDIPQEARDMFLRARQRSIVNVANGRIGLSPLDSPDTGKSLSSENLYYRTVDQCHIDYLTAMGVQSSLVVPIVHHDPKDQLAKPRLWGLLVSHHSTPKNVEKRELQLVQQAADHIAVAIAQSHLLNQVRAEKQQEAIVNQITTLLHSLPTIQCQTALEATVAAFGGSGGRVYVEQGAELYTCGEQPTLPQGQASNVIEQHPLWQDWLGECKIGNIWAINDLHKERHWQDLAPLFSQTKIRGMLIIPLSYRQSFIGILTIFRPELNQEILWAGERDTSDRQRLPRLSFAAWLEERKGQAPEWKPEEISLGRAIADQFAIAIQQQQMYQQVHTLNSNLEKLVTERTAQLQKSLDLTRVIKQVSDQIRRNLDYKITLQTLVQEVRKLLKTDRVLIYQLFGDDEGEVIVEDADSNLRPILGLKTPLECFPEESARLYLRGRVRAINNTASEDITPCHREFLLSLQVKANLIVPISMGNQLWGLIIAHECFTPRNWQEEEIDLLQNVADEAVLTIQHAQLYENSRAAESAATEQAKQLVQALEQIQKTQAQLIKSEKMSSVGIWALGVAHQIQNPVNFISSHLSDIGDSIQKLLELLRLYQLNYPHPNGEISYHTQAVNLEFLIQKLPKILLTMKLHADRINSMMSSLRSFSYQDVVAMKVSNQSDNSEIRNVFSEQSEIRSSEFTKETS
ncbi:MULTISPECIES: GAF domain-containing protein [Calothrix]|uniref:GAF domain-containing protein n=2 Tax=Calothrix TaxID=1186 RepID=A0ABR8A3E6_9CYAN|nr:MULTISPECIES: GAF domain-containing protein [Calothrix]MBD2193905.1 GAF domain-containing protein [Calothrix parietina FACHB-288]MBD2222911.1 GAF domain-containing protein [Calothrix anomala FACHB-343]